MVGSVSSTAATQLVGQLGQLVLFDNLTKATPTITITTSSVKSFEVNSMQITETSQPLGDKKKKNNNRHKKNASIEPTEQTNFESNARSSKEKQKSKYPFMVCQEDHMTKDCLHLPDVRYYVK